MKQKQLTAKQKKIAERMKKLFEKAVSEKMAFIYNLANESFSVVNSKGMNCFAGDDDDNGEILDIKNSFTINTGMILFNHECGDYIRIN